MTHVVDNRVVLTYQPVDWPLGVITGYGNDRTFHVEHVIVFPWAPQSTLSRMLRLGMAEAQRRGYHRVRFVLPARFPLTPRLSKLAARMGFLRDGESWERAA